MLIAVYILTTLIFLVALVLLFWPHRVEAGVTQSNWSFVWSFYPFKLSFIGKKLTGESFSIKIFSKQIFSKLIIEEDNEVESAFETKSDNSSFDSELGSIVESDTLDAEKKFVKEKSPKSKVVESLKEPSPKVEKSETSKNKVEKKESEKSEESEDDGAKTTVNNTENNTVNNTENNTEKLSFFQKIKESQQALKKIWKQESGFIKKQWRWVKIASSKSSLAVMPNHLFVNFSGGHDDFSKTGKLIAWVSSFNLFFSFNNKIRVNYSPDFTAVGNWEFDGGVVWKFSFLKLLITGVYILVSFPVVASFKFWRRFRRDGFVGIFREIWGL